MTELNVEPLGSEIEEKTCVTVHGTETDQVDIDFDNIQFLSDMPRNSLTKRKCEDTSEQKLNRVADSDTALRPEDTFCTVRPDRSPASDVTVESTSAPIVGEVAEDSCSTIIPPDTRFKI